MESMFWGEGADEGHAWDIPSSLALPPAPDSSFQDLAWPQGQGGVWTAPQGPALSRAPEEASVLWEHEGPSLHENHTGYLSLSCCPTRVCRMNNHRHARQLFPQPRRLTPTSLHLSKSSKDNPHTQPAQLHSPDLLQPSVALKCGPDSNPHPRHSLDPPGEFPKTQNPRLYHQGF